MPILNLAGDMAVKLVYQSLQTVFSAVFINLSRIIECWTTLHIILPGKPHLIIAKDM